MGWNGSGTFTRTNGTYTGGNIWLSDQQAATPISASIHDVHDTDLANGITACLCKNGENSATGNLPMGGFLHTNVGAATAITNYARYDQVQKSSPTWGGTSGGTANAQTFSLTPTLTSGNFVAGATFRFKCGSTNTGATTININSLGAKTLLYKGFACVGGELVAGVIAEIVYDGTSFHLLEHCGGWATWSPTFSGIGSLTWSASASVSRFQRHGNLANLKLLAAGTTGGVDGNELRFTLPLTAVDSNDILVARVYNGSTTVGGFVGFASTTVAAGSRYDNANVGLGASRTLYVEGFYECA